DHRWDIPPPGGLRPPKLMLCRNCSGSFRILIDPQGGISYGSRSGAGREPPETEGGLERILVVDPDDRVAALLANALIGRGYVIDRIEGGRRAAELAVAGDYALVLLELL